MSDFVETHLDFGQKTDARQVVLDKILTLPLNQNQQKLAPGTTEYSLSQFPDNTRAAFLLTKLKTYKLTPRELKELESHCFFPEESPDNKLLARERRKIKIGNRNLEIVNQNPDISLDEKHIRTIRRVLGTASKRTPLLTEGLLKIFIIPAKDEQYAERPGYNGEWTKRQCDKNPSGIVLTQNGYRLDIAHRISGVDNLRGTLAHEIGHSIYFLYPRFVQKFRKVLGYQPITDNRGRIINNQWERRVGNNKVAYYIHKETGIISYMPYAPKDLGLLPSKYAGYYPEEDIAETYVAWLFKQPLDITRKKLLDNLF